MQEKIWREITSYRHAVLSTIDSDGFPRCLPVEVAVKPDATELQVECTVRTDPIPSRNLCCLLFHSYEDGLENLRQLMMMGSCVQEGNGLLFIHRKIFDFSRRGGVIATLKFILEGKKRARRYLEAQRRAGRINAARK